ncbi:hypothetical protein [Oryzomonas rubra]|uniref:Uncharacterized protein n=1 Tax=Oryzomonas rubra TaxID=2509454 RepID=A0A5A9X6M7_9BACT|nr:hypothetical protein [Oryzomonas rubra]KAA0888098.1 hypothetical protein ET418_17000 [Oryzomonas rubra]
MKAQFIEKGFSEAEITQANSIARQHGYGGAKVKRIKSFRGRLLVTENTPLVSMCQTHIYLILVGKTRTIRMPRQS